MKVTETAPNKKYACYECDKLIKGMHTMTIDDKWMGNGGFGSPPPNAIVHLCSKKCENKHFRHSSKISLENQHTYSAQKNK